MKPPMSEPAMPSRMVTMKPPGSLPGIRSLAMNPTTSPNTIHDRIAIAHPPFFLGCVLCNQTTIGAPSSPPSHQRQAAPFVFEKPALALETATIADEAATRSDNP